MNATERNMLDMLRKGRDEYGVVAVKAEFEAEGTRPDELHRLLELAHRADLRVALKIGGCEAVSDLLAAKLYGADYLIAPMVETTYALTKYVEARTKSWGEEAADAKFLYNLETVTGLANLPEMLPIAADHLDGIVFGRVDFTLSSGLSRAEINSRQVSDAVLRVAQACADQDLELVVGGGVSAEAGFALREFRAIRLDRFETRKVVFDGAVAESRNFEQAVAEAAAFELAWLENKRDYYGAIAGEDAKRIAMIRDRSQSAAAGRVPSMAA
ncbi:aldolase/citrate lyase family protein [Sphingosinicella sp. CPCC 101087]|uniref:aldolase/citrate lyase family protein n=1 Tax=Sphingosinicella sp. CPCC 101087 TaxID=2497754 RepID=UPI001FB04E8A|nr:aldolase/citrate lyase family protein [Sphingosinicella sp. CPCC 101087]